jgi:D-methionine transport system substrate-binding protein
LRDKVIDANLFQHKPFINNAAKKLKINLVALNTVYLNTLGLFSKQLKSVNEIPLGLNLDKNGQPCLLDPQHPTTFSDEGCPFLSIVCETPQATVTIANDVINNDRGLRLLASNKLIKLKDNAGQFVTQRDIADNPKNLKIKEVEGVQVVRAINDVDFIVSSPKTVALAGIKPQSMGQETTKDNKYALALVTLQSRETEPKIQNLNKLLNHPQVKDFINKQYEGRLIPVF